MEDKFGRKSSIKLESKHLRIDGSALGEKEGTCYIPVMVNQLSENIILGQIYFDNYYTVFDQTPTTEDGAFTNQIAFGVKQL